MPLSVEFFFVRRVFGCSLFGQALLVLWGVLFQRVRAKKKLFGVTARSSDASDSERSAFSIFRDLHSNLANFADFCNPSFHFAGFLRLFRIFTEYYYVVQILMRLIVFAGIFAEFRRSFTRIPEIYSYSPNFAEISRKYLKLERKLAEF